MIKLTQANIMNSRPVTTNSSQIRRRHKPIEITIIMVFMVLVCFLGFILTSGLLSSKNHMSRVYAYAQQTKTALDATPTATPFQPLGMVDDTQQIISTPNPALSNQLIPTLTRMDLQKPEGQLNVLLLGSDVRPDEGGFRTDVIVWVSLNPKDEFVSAVSFPRDLFVQIPGQGENRINVAFPSGGFDLLADTMELNFGVRPDRYLLVDFNGFKTVINNLGGIQVQTAQNLTDSCAKWINPSGMCSVGPGPVQMNGEVALWYVRSRYSSNDIDRARRAQEVIEAIFRRLMSLDIILKVPELYNAYATYIQTDITLGEVIPMLPLASKIYEKGDIRNYVIGYDLAYDWITIQGAQVLVPDIEGIRDLLIKALSLD